MKADVTGTRELIERWAAATQERHVEAVLEHHDPNVVM